VEKGPVFKEKSTTWQKTRIRQLQKPPCKKLPKGNSNLLQADLDKKNATETQPIIDGFLMV
jgi:hypothetical protein